MSLAPKPFVLQLSQTEISEIEPPSGDGGHQGLHETIRDQLQKTGDVVTLNDAELGQLIRYMTQYGSGGFQGRLRRAFLRPIRALLDL